MSCARRFSVIEANTSLALARDRDEAWYRAAFTRLDGETRRMRRLLEDMLWLARFDSLQGPPQSEPVDLGVLAEQIGDRFRAVAELRAQTLSVDVEAGPHVVSAPPEWLDRLVACSSTTRASIPPEAGPSAWRLVGRKPVRLTVDDSGPGIPPDQPGSRFDRFHRATDQQSGPPRPRDRRFDRARHEGHWRIGRPTLVAPA